MIVKRVPYLVYKYEAQRPVITQAVCKVDSTFLTESRVLSFFAADKERKRTFSKLLHKGFVGLVLHKDDEWVTYAWMATPDSPQPFHLPQWIKGLGAYWVFYCGTKEQYRNRGYYKLALSLLVQHAFDLVPQPSIYIDTSPSNTPSRRAIINVGFRPRGVLECISLSIPRLGRITFGKWDQGAQHPELIS